MFLHERTNTNIMTLMWASACSAWRDKSKNFYFSNDQKQGREVIKRDCVWERDGSKNYYNNNNERHDNSWKLKIYADFCAQLSIMDVWRVLYTTKNIFTCSLVVYTYQKLFERKENIFCLIYIAIFLRVQPRILQGSDKDVLYEILVRTDYANIFFIDVMIRKVPKEGVIGFR